MLIHLNCSSFEDSLSESPVYQIHSVFCNSQSVLKIYHYIFCWKISTFQMRNPITISRSQVLIAPNLQDLPSRNNVTNAKKTRAFS